MKPEETVLKIAAPNHAAQLIERKSRNRRIGTFGPLSEGLQVLRYNAYRSIALRETRPVRMSRCHLAHACQNRTCAAFVEFPRGVTSYQRAQKH